MKYTHHQYFKPSIFKDQHEDFDYLSHKIRSNLARGHPNLPCQIYFLFNYIEKKYNWSSYRVGKKSRNFQEIDLEVPATPPSSPSLARQARPRTARSAAARGRGSPAWGRRCSNRHRQIGRAEGGANQAHTFPYRRTPGTLVLIGGKRIS